MPLQHHCRALLEGDVVRQRHQVARLDVARLGMGGDIRRARWPGHAVAWSARRHRRRPPPPPPSVPSRTAASAVQATAVMGVDEVDPTRWCLGTAPRRSRAAAIRRPPLRDFGAAGAVVRIAWVISSRDSLARGVGEPAARRRVILSVPADPDAVLRFLVLVITPSGGLAVALEACRWTRRRENTLRRIGWDRSSLGAHLPSVPRRIKRG